MPNWTFSVAEGKNRGHGGGGNGNVDLSVEGVYEVYLSSISRSSSFPSATSQSSSSSSSKVIAGFRSPAYCCHPVVEIVSAGHWFRDKFHLQSRSVSQSGSMVTHRMLEGAMGWDRYGNLC